MLKKKLRNQKGFTLIEIIAVLVILGILAAVAIPKFVDLQSEARLKAAMAVYSGMQSAASMNFAKGALSPSTSTPITDMASLIAVLDPPGCPDGWTCTGSTATNSTTASLVITITAPEVEGTSRAVLSKTGF